jgi:signal transduction histidine kinase
MNQRGTKNGSALTRSASCAGRIMPPQSLHAPASKVALPCKLVSRMRGSLANPPTTGLMDPQRARRSTERLLRGLRDIRANGVLANEPGASTIGSTPVNDLVKTLEPSRLLGAGAISNGLPSNFAKTLNKPKQDLGLINQQLESEIKERKRAEQALRDLSNTILQMQEEERKRLSRELHDELGQTLTAISVNLATLERNGPVLRNPAAAIAIAQRLLREAMDTVHHLAHELRPGLLDELGLVPALRSHVQRFAARTGLRVRLRANPIAESLSIEKKTALFRIAQESLTNVAKHAAANRVDLVVRKARNSIRMEIADDGKSFREADEDSAKRRGRLGLLGMQERVRLVNGRFAIKPEPGKGTTVQVVVPFERTGSESSSQDRGSLKP